ncbi:putative Ig domain-containing protein [Costertonia aggregata]|uniref:PD40 domain-containing protein n=1 Tax=Costertonia aggregata TaxID=343403 RepID=A0A7H9APJ9_9FLAO|nr:putative Ig domain-containing protein [Costertonia aggregata]QLG45347.1 PD40 domain-containing protein [Costertonia aggregata]
MVRKFILLFLFPILICCRSLAEPADYFGQTTPDSIPVIFAPDSISMKGRLEQGVSFSPDTQELAFGILNKNDFNGEIYYSKKVNNYWIKPIAFAPLEGENVFLPYFSPDGKSMLFAKSKPDANNFVTDIWQIEKINGDWGSPKRLQPPLSSASREANASMSYDGTIYFSSNRNCEGMENCFTADLFYSKLVDNEYQNAEPIPEFISPNDEESVFISPKEEYIVFCRYTDDKTGMDLYISYRDKNKNWSAPKILDATINSKYWDRRPFVSIDNKYLFFTQLQIQENELIESDIFWVNTSKVFTPYVYNPLSDVNLKVGEKFEISVPFNYYKDIDDPEVKVSLNQNSIEWLKFDSKKMKLSGLPTVHGEFELTFSAVDRNSNTTEDKVTLTVIK